MSWYHGGPLLQRLETVNGGARANTIDLRFPVQLVIRLRERPCGYAGTVAFGVVRAGDEIVVLPSGLTTRINSIDAPDGRVVEAAVGDAVYSDDY